MKTLLRIVLVLVISAGYLLASGWLIFQQDAVTGMLWGIGLWIVPFALLVLSIVAFINRGLPKLRIRSRASAAGFFILSFLVGASLVGIAFANAFAIEVGAPEQDALAKIGWYGKWTGHTALQENLEKIEGTYATYYVTPENRAKVAEMERLLPMIENRVDRYLPELPEAEKPEIELHRDASTLQLLGADTSLGGFYTTITERIHVHDNQTYWEEVLIHEYTHYRVHQFQKQQTGKGLTLPLWLEEGFAEMMTGTLPLGPFDAYRDLPLEEVHRSSNRLTTEVDGVNIYTYGQLLVTELTRKAGVDQLQDWLLEEDPEVLEADFRKLYGLSENDSIQTVIIEEYQKQIAISAEHRLEATSHHFSGWDESIELLEETLYLPMYIQALDHFYQHSKEELAFDDAALLLAEVESLDITRPASYFIKERALLEAGKGSLETAITMLEALDSSNADAIHALIAQEELRILKRLNENPYDQEAKAYLEQHPLFGEGTADWLKHLQKSN
ncbi:hypothetical protein CF394_07675 [Tetzosporium hominis]|uniref:Uncharacterized protein n=1 Tax=Tetzosporium hominis TaxID=2020506 RepID=A0A264W3E0_9BACL|nr:hypothetical protein [Tetzosporium hominis]OZS78103.1 hypothetical protein CF394_07675 [Tetzosporium hominis]